ncbi:unnamed protein product [Paramecium octaurelia]|uniref:Uncharacterized protein n=1 Tax=Paramecium octaurelia TaxID=43137 RepID=A0A8S1U9W7_PAROT|nr:unnamed protein product [Paramecium octaurelia]
MKFSIIIPAVIIAIILNIMNGLDFFLNFSSIQQYENCQYLDVDIKGPEDMQQYNRTTIIVGSGNFQKLYAQNRIELEQQGIYAIINSDQQDFKIMQLQMIGYPKDVALNIHGIYLKKQNNRDYLFLINHAYKYGGERIEIFQVSEQLDLTYQHSILMEQQYNGILNDLIVIDKNRLLATMSMPLSDPIEGRSSMSFWNFAQTLFIFLAGLKQTYVIDCRFETTEVLIHPQCKKLQETSGNMLNGITWNRLNTIWVADSAQKGFSEYLIKGETLEFSRFLQTTTRIDNVEFQEETNTIIFGQGLQFSGFFSLLSFMKTVDLQRDTQFEHWGSLSQFNLTSNSFEVLVQSKNLSKGISGGLASGQNLFIGSWCDISVMVCQKKKEQYQ